jgi:uncharacterized protein
MVDTNVLVYAIDQQSRVHGVSRALLATAADEASAQRFSVTPQILAEFYAVVTSSRRVQSPISPQDALDGIERLMALPGLSLLPIPVDVVSRWVALARAHPVAGANIFDMQLVATMLANGVRRIYTFNQNHFRPFTEIEAIAPQ